MAAYEYQALDEKGRTKKGVANGDSAKQVRGDLRAQGLTPLGVNKVADSSQPKAAFSSSGSSRQRRTKISNSDLSILTRQMATLIGSGLTIEETLAAMIKQSEGQKLKGIMSDVRSLVSEGLSLSEAIGLYPRSFPEIYRASISAGEQSGTLDDVLERLADYLEARHSIQQRLTVALIYPIFLTIASLGIVVALVAFVVPKVVSVFEEQGQDLPWLTQALITLSDFLANHGLVLLLGLVLLVIASVWYFSKEKPKRWLHNLMLNMFGIRKLVRSTDTARMARTLSIMVGSGVPLLTSMRSTEGVMTNVVLKEDLNQAAEKVAQGVSLSRALEHGGHFPPLLTQMVASGENSGRLGHMLEKAATATENELESRISILVGLFEPIMILVMGFVVLVIVMAILMPIFNLNQLLA
jgi:general secretion pathway protein F